MGSRRLAWVGGVLGLMLWGASGGAQAIPAGSEEALHAMVRVAGVIFAGRVIAIRRHEAVGGTTGVVEIEFAVDDAIRGVSGGTYILREWGGLWATGYEPFAVGKQYLMLLHAAGAAGLSSPVGGSDGAIPIRGGGSEETAGAGVRGTSAGAVGRLVDLRWVAARAARTVSFKAEPVGRPTSRPVELRTEMADAAGLQVDVAGPGLSGAAAAEGAAYLTVLGMLRSWEKVDDVAR